MAEVVEKWKFTKEAEGKLPDDLAHYTGLAIDRGRGLHGLDAEGNPDKKMSDLGHVLTGILVKLEFLEPDNVETTAPVGMSPELVRVLEELKKLDQRLDKFEQRLAKLEAAAGIKTDQGTSGETITPTIQEAINQAVAEQTADLQKQLEEKDSHHKTDQEKIEQLEAEIKRLKGEPDPIVKEDDPALEEVGGFRRGDEVVFDLGNSKYEPGYNVVGFATENNHPIILIQKLTDKEPKKVGEASIKKRTEVKDEDLVGADLPPDKTTTPLGRRVDVKRPWYYRYGRRGPEHEYYQRDDDRRYYYVGENGEPVYVDEREVYGRDRGIGAVALAGAAVGGAILWELIGEKIFGIGEGSSHHLKQVINDQTAVIHNQGVEINKLNKANQQLNTVTGYLRHAHDHDRRMIEGLHNQVHRAVKHEDRLIEQLHAEVARDHAQEMKGISGLHDRLQNTGAYWGLRYPWDWAANKVGTLKAEGWLHTLAGRAADKGHKVVWLHNNGREILQVDGTTNTQKVIQTITHP
jgi:hypothetical protein